MAMEEQPQVLMDDCDAHAHSAMQLRGLRIAKSYLVHSYVSSSIIPIYSYSRAIMLLSQGDAACSKSIAARLVSCARGPSSGSPE